MKTRHLNLDDDLMAERSRAAAQEGRREELVVRESDAASDSQSPVSRCVHGTRERENDVEHKTLLICAHELVEQLALNSFQ